MHGRIRFEAALCVFLVLASPLAFAATPAASAPAKPAKLGLCAACHGEDGHARAAGTPHLAGQDEAYLRKALTDFRTGARTASPMNAIAGTLQAKDIQALARWYATRKPAMPQ
jgi:cytochrome c553